MDTLNQDTQVGPHPDNRNTTPEWVRKIDTKSLQLISNIQRTLCKKETAVRKLETHKDNESFPPSMRIAMKIAVTAEQQAGMDAIVDQATKVFQMTVLDGLLQIRQAEVSQTKAELAKAAYDRHEEVNTTFGMLNEEGLAPPVSDKQKWNEEFTKREETAIRDVRTKDFQERKELIEKQLAQAASRQERRMEIELQDPAMIALEAKVKHLEGLVKSQSKKTNTPKKDTVKPVKPKTGGGQNKKGSKDKSKKESDKKSSKEATPGNAKDKPKGGAKGNRKRRSA
jgi:hypothetical protein